MHWQKKVSENFPVTDPIKAALERRRSCIHGINNWYPTPVLSTKAVGKGGNSREEARRLSVATRKGERDR